MGLETRGGGQEEHFQLPPKQHQLLQPPAAPPPVWTSQLVIPLLEAGSESTAQQQQQFETEGQGMVVDAGKNVVELKTGEKGWLRDLVMQLSYESCLSCSVGAVAAEPIDVWAGAGIGTRWLIAMEDTGCGRHGHPGGEPANRLHQTKAIIGSCHVDWFPSVPCLHSRAILQQQVVELCCTKRRHMNCRDI